MNQHNTLTGRWLVHMKNGFPVRWTPILAKRRDMFEISCDEAARRFARQERDAIGRRIGMDGTDMPAFAHDAGERVEAVTAPVTTGLTPPSREQILATEDRKELESIGRAFGFEVDRRKSAKTIQAELIDHLGL